MKNTLPGKYEGFAEPKYAGMKMSSIYLPGYDGTKLAVDIVRPTNADGSYAEGRFPVVMLVSRDVRFKTDRKVNGVDIIEYCVPYGYVGVVMSNRGCGASYGTNDSFASIENRQDVTCILNWIGEQEWSDGQATLFGGSNRGLIQLATAVAKPHPSPVLKGITPVVANADFYYQDYPNGVSALPERKMKQHKAGTDSMKQGPMSKEEFIRKFPPVDEDTDGSMAYEAYLTGQYKKNHGFMNWLLLPDMCRDDENPNLGGEKTNLTIPPREDLDIFKQTNIRIHQFAGEIESGTFGQLMACKEWGGSITVGPWDHRESRVGSDTFPEGAYDFKAEHLKWFDNCMKHVDNGFDQAPPFIYYTIGAKPGQYWRCSDTYPLETARPMQLYFCPEKSGTVNSVNDGCLYREKPEQVTGTDYKVDTTIQVFDNGEGATIDRMRLWWEGNMAPGVDSKGLTFTSSPLFRMRDNEITGVTKVDLWVSGTQNDADFICYLEEVDKDGKSTYIAQGVQRASHRTEAPREAWNETGATYHPSMRADVEKCLEEGLVKPVHLQFHIEPVSYVFKKGSRVRITVTCADYKAYQHNMYDKSNPPTITLYQGGDKASCVTIPFIEHTENTYNGTVKLDGCEGPGTLYFFEKNVYLYANGVWKRIPAADASYHMEGGTAVFDKAGFTFVHEGDPIMDGIIQNYQGGDSVKAPFPAHRRVVVDTMPLDHIKPVLYTTDVKTIYMDIFEPIDGTKPAPCIAVIHGYGGTPGKLKPQAVDYLKNGYAVASLDLRSYPGNYFPDYVNDLKGQIRYLRAHAQELGIDPDAIGCEGSSLGGNGTLMLGVSGGEEALEGNVGGNLEFSSRIQAMSAGYAWCDVLYMGKDLVEEYAAFPEELRKKKFANSDGPNAPLGHVIGFTGPGKGMAVLREYMESGKEGTDPYMDEMLAKARYASPVNHMAPDTCPTALWGGLGMTGVDIPQNQSNRTFAKLNSYGVDCYMFSNSNGFYGQKPLIRHALMDFFDSALKRKEFPKKSVMVPGKKIIVQDYVDRKLDYAACVELNGKLLLAADYLKERYGFEAEAVAEVDGHKYIDPAVLDATEIGYEYYPDKNMAVLLPRKLMQARTVSDRTS